MSVREDVDDDDGDDDDNNNFFNPRQPTKNNVASATNFGEAVAIKPEEIVISENLNHLFPKAKEIFNEPKVETNEIPLPNYETIMREFNEGEIPF